MRIERKPPNQRLQTDADLRFAPYGAADPWSLHAQIEELTKPMKEHDEGTSPILGPDGRPAESRKPFRRRVVRSAKGLFVAIAAFVAAIAAFWSDLRSLLPIDTSTDVSAQIEAAIEMATTDKNSEQRVAGISKLAVLWKSADSSDLIVFARTLTGLLESDSESVRMAAADAIGDGYSESTPEERQEQIRRLLYGSKEDWYVGEVVKLNWRLQEQEVTTPGEEALRDGKMLATREAIRKNWENLRDVHLKGASLVGAQLYEADLRGAYLEHADLRCANLRGANLSEAKVHGVAWTEANVQDLLPDSVRQLAVAEGAVAMTDEEWDARTPSKMCSALTGGV